MSVRSGNRTFHKAIELNEILYDSKVNAEEKKRTYDLYLKLIRKASYQGDKDAQYEYAQTFEGINFFGENKFSYPNKCFYWYSKSAVQGHAEACNNLATMYEIGNGCEKKMEMAVLFYKKSINKGSWIAKKNYRLLKSNISKYGIKTV